MAVWGFGVEVLLSIFGVGILLVDGVCGLWCGAGSGFFALGFSI